MKRFRRNIISWLLLAIIILPIIAITCLQVAQAYIKTNREERLTGGYQEKVVLSAKNIVWEEDGKELWVGDRMFDVSSFFIVNGKYHLTGVYDDHETQIAGSLFHSLLSDNGSGILHLLFLLQCFVACLFSPLLLVKYYFYNKQISFYYIILPQPCFRVLGPPPRC